GDPHAPSAGGGPDGVAAVALVATHAIRPHAGPARPRPPDRPLVEQRVEDGGLVLLARGEHEGHRLTMPLGAGVHLGRKAALAVAECLGFWVPPFAPAACWCARITEPSTKWMPQSTSPAASAWRWTASNSRSQIPASRQRRKRLYSVCHGPYRSGTSRQGAPVRIFHRIPLRTVR